MAGVGGIINASLSGAISAQLGIENSSKNVANADSENHTRTIIERRTNVLGGDILGVQTGPVKRVIDERLQRVLRDTSADLGRLEVIENTLVKIDEAFGDPESESNISGLMSRLTSSIQDMAALPESVVARQTVVTNAETLALEIRSLSSLIQDLRLQAEQDIGVAVDEINESLVTIDKLNDDIAARYLAGKDTAALEDQRDAEVDKLVKYMDVHYLEGDELRYQIFTGRGYTLLDENPNFLEFDGRSAITAEQEYNTDPALRQVGTIQIKQSTGEYIDLLATNHIRSGEISGLVELRDEILVEAQAQLDEFAHMLALSLSEREPTIAGSINGAATASTLNLSTLTNIEEGDRVVLRYIDNSNPDEPAVEEIKFTAVPNGATVGAGEFELGLTLNDTLTALQTALDAATVDFTITNTASDITATETAPLGDYRILGLDLHQGPDLNVDVFGDQFGFYQGGTLFYNGDDPTMREILDNFPQKTGFAGRIAVTQQILNDNTLLVSYDQVPPDDPGLAPLGDNSRPLELFKRLTQDGWYADPEATGIQSAAQPFSKSIQSFATTVVGYQAQQLNDYAGDLEITESIHNTVQNNYDRVSGVNIDEELMQMLQDQRWYEANVRFFTTATELLDTLLAAT